MSDGGALAWPHAHAWHDSPRGEAGRVMVNRQSAALATPHGDAAELAPAPQRR